MCSGRLGVKDTTTMSDIVMVYRQTRAIANSVVTIVVLVAHPMAGSLLRSGSTLANTS